MSAFDVATRSVVFWTGATLVILGVDLMLLALGPH